MFIDCTGSGILLDHEMYPTGLVIQIITLSVGASVGAITSEEGTRLSVKITEDWPLHRLPCKREMISITEQHLDVDFEEIGGFGFDVESYFLNSDNILIIRNFMISVVERPGIGWTVEFSGPNDGISWDRAFSIKLPQFNPRAIIDLGTPSTAEKPEEKPPGRPIWERLGEDD